MTGLRRAFGLFVSVVAVSATSSAFAPSFANAPDEMSDTFAAAIELLHRGKKTEALAELKKVAAMSPDQKSAYALWTSRDYADWRDLLVEGGDFELVAKRLIDLARVERKAIANDKDTILALVKTATTSEDVAERRQATRTLSADHGTYAVPYLLPLLADEGDVDRRVLAMHALSQLGGEAAVATAVALKSDNAVLRRNAAYVLGNLGSAYGTAALQQAAAADEDPVVREAASGSLTRLGAASGSALSSYLAAGDAYWRRSDAALVRGEAGEVVWDWKDGQLVGTAIPRALYGSEMSKRAFYDALRVDPNSTQALSGLARAFVDGQTRIDAMGAAGQDVSAWKDAAGATLIAVNGAGVDALDLALTSSVSAGDASTASALCRVLGPLASTPTGGLRSALASNDGAIRSEAAVALAQVAARSGTPAGAEVVSVLGQSTARESLRLALVIDSDPARANAVAEALRGMGTHASVADNSVLGLTILHRAPALDVIFVADTLADVTTAQVIDEVKGNERMANVAVVVLTNDKEGTAGTYGDRIAGTSTGAADLDAAKPALSAELTGDRELARNLASRSAEALAHLGSADDLGPALSGLALATVREDATAIPAMAALGARGTGAQAPAILAALTDDSRSEAVRAAAGAALARVVGRDASALGADDIAKVEAVVRSGAAMPVREAAARVLGSMQIDPAARAKLLEKLRG